MIDAAAVVTLGYSDRDERIVVLGEDGSAALFLDKTEANDVAARLIELATTLPDPSRRPIRRLAIVDEHLREVDGRG